MGFGKTKFEMYRDKVLMWLRKAGVNTEKNMSGILDLITDYFDINAQKPCFEPRHAAQCIKFELGRDYGPSHAYIKGIRESVGSDIDDFIDAVLDSISDLDYDSYRYYNRNREEIIKLAKDSRDAIEVAQKCVDFYTNAEDWDEYERMEKMDAEFENVPKPFEPDEYFAKLRDMRGSRDYLTNPTDADGRYAGKTFPISYAIANNDDESLESYIHHGVPLSLITGDKTDTETIDFKEQYRDEFINDYRLLTEHVDKSIDDALATMLDSVDYFIVSPFDLYNLFVSDKSKDDILYTLIYNTEKYSQQDDIVPYFDVPYSALWNYAEAWF